MVEADRPRYLILGLGLTGFSCIRYLAKSECNIRVVDTRKKPPYLAKLYQEYPQIKFFTSSINKSLLIDKDILVVSPGIRLNQDMISAAQRAGITIINDVEIFSLNTSAPIIAITGTNGKSTTTSLLGKIAQDLNIKVAVGGNLGTPCLDLLDAQVELYVLEVSSFQLEWTSSLAPTVAVLLNITSDHLDRYASFSHYCEVKMRVLKQCQYAVVNLDDPAVIAHLPDHIASPLKYFSIQEGKQQDFHLLRQDNKNYIAYQGLKLLATNSLHIKGLHQIANVLAVLNTSSILGWDRTRVVKAIKGFTGLEHRCQLIGVHQGVEYINDSKATNVDAAIAAIAGIGADITGEIIWIAGGLAKNADFSPLTNPLQKYSKTAILFGADAALIQQHVPSDIQVFIVSSMFSAVNLAVKKACRGDVVLLSPACASFDDFDSFEHRGRCFAEAVTSLLS